MERQQTTPQPDAGITITESSLTVSQLGESEILQLIFPHLPTNDYVIEGPGDDCAVISAPDGRYVVSTDILIENVHFKREWSSAFAVGWRAAMQNLADVAAMGAIPTSLVVGLGMPKDLPVAWVEGFAQGLGHAAASVGASCVGGDLSSAPSLFISVTVHGDLEGRAPILRSGATPGDILALSGHTGWSAAGLHLNSAGISPDSADLTTRQNLDLAARTFQAPTSPIDMGRAAAHAGATAMMDVSDGLLKDCERIARASGVSLTIDFPQMAAHVLGPHEIPELDHHISGSMRATTHANAERATTDHEYTECEGTEHEGTEHASTTVPSAIGLRKIAEFLLPNHREQASDLVGKWMLTGGEDHSLLATFPPHVALPDGFVRIGTVTPHNATQNTQPAQAQGTVRVEGAVRVEGFDISELEAGWDHFR